MEETISNSANISQIIIDTINTLLSTLFSSIDNSVYDLLDKLAFINVNIFDNSLIENFLGYNSNNGILIIANSLLFAVCLYYCFKLLYSHLTGVSIENPYQFIFKLLIFGCLINASYFICEFLIYFTSIISDAILDVGKFVLNQNINFSKLVQNLNSSISVDATSLNVFSFDGLLKSLCSISFINLILSYSLRYIMVKVLILITPFAFLTLINSSTSWFFKAWFKIFLSLLFLQPFISIVLLIFFSLNFTSPDITSKILCIGAMYALIKSNTYVQHFIGGISTNVVTNIRSLRSKFR